MAGEKKKRKLDVLVEEKEEESEDAKMEKFYELIRSSKDIRGRMMMMMMKNAERVKEEEKKKKANENKEVGIWKPTFKLEDFMEDKLCSSWTKNQAGPSSSKREDDRGRDEGDAKGGGDGLNLNLSL